MKAFEKWLKEKAPNVVSGNTKDRPAIIVYDAAEEVWRAALEWALDTMDKDKGSKYWIRRELGQFDIAPSESRNDEGYEIKPLSQYLDEYINHEYALGELVGSDKSWRELLEQALDAYQSTENVTIRIERNESGNARCVGGNNCGD